MDPVILHHKALMSMLLQPPLWRAIVLGTSVGVGSGLLGLVETSAHAGEPPSGNGVKLGIPGSKLPAVEIGVGKGDGKKPAAAEAKKPEPITTWSSAELAEATARCNAVLKSVDAVIVPETPFRTGACGSAAPMRLIAIGKSPEVALNPPPVLSCDMIAALATWLKKDVQPLAKKHLGSPVIRIDAMSDYSCRAAYGRMGNRLSEHGRANALDIRGFVTAKGQPTTVLAEWGKTQRDIKREIAQAKAAAEKAEKQRAEAAQTSAGTKAQVTPQSQRPAPASGPAIAQPAHKPSTVGEMAADAFDAVTSIVKSTIVEGTSKSSEREGHALAEPSRLGGPKEELPAPVITSSKSRFLREAHAAACRIFGTTLGPEANEPHRNHLHIDMATRRNGGYCR